MTTKESSIKVREYKGYPTTVLVLEVTLPENLRLPDFKETGRNLGAEYTQPIGDVCVPESLCFKDNAGNEIGRIRIGPLPKNIKESRTAYPQSISGFGRYFSDADANNRPYFYVDGIRLKDYAGYGKTRDCAWKEAGQNLLQIAHLLFPEYKNYVSEALKKCVI